MAVLNNVWGTNPMPLAAPSAASVVANTSLAAFQGWPVAAQASFVGRYGAGNPPQVVLGSGTGQTLLTMTPLGGVVTEPLPLSFAIPPAQMDYATFTSWSSDVQAAYIQQNTKDGNSVEFGAGDHLFAAERSDSIVAYQSGSGSPALATNVLFAEEGDTGSTLESDLPPVTRVSLDEGQVPLTASAFFALPQDQQKELASGVLILDLSGSTAADPVIALTLDDGTAIEVRVPSSAYPGFSTPLTSQISPVDGDVFKTWPPEVQKAYLLEAAGDSGTASALLKPGGTATPPIAIVFASGSGGSGFTAALMSNVAGSAVTLTPNPAGFADMLAGTATPSVDAFLSLSPSLQLAYTLARTTLSQTSCTVGTGADTLTVARSSSDPCGLAYTPPASTSASSIDPDAFGLEPMSSQASSLQGLSSGSVAFVTSVGQRIAAVIGTTASQVIAAGPASGSGVVSIYDVPSDFSTPPQGLASSIFLSWSPAVRACYLDKNKVAGGLAPNGQVTFADGMTYGFDADNRMGRYVPDLADLTTTGYTKADIPYDHVGSAAGDSKVASKAAAIYTAAASTASPSTTSYATLDPQTFEAWTTEQQRAYITAQIAANPSSLTATTPFTIGASSSSGNAPIDVFIGARNTAASPAPVYIAQNLQKTDIAKMSFTDQQTLTAAAGYPALAAAYGLMPNATTQATGATSATATIQALIASYRSTVTSSTVPPYVQSLFTAQIDLISAQLFGGALPSAPVAGTTTTVPTAPTLPNPQTGGSAIFSETDIQAQLDAIQTRFKRVAAFAAEATKVRQTITFEYQTSSDPNSAWTSYIYDPGDDVENNPPGERPKQLLQSYEASSGEILGPDAAGVYTSGQSTTFITAFNANGQQYRLDGADPNVYAIRNFTVTNANLSYDGNHPSLSPLPTSTDNDATIRSGYEKFIAQEAVITATKMQAANLAQSGTVAGSTQSLDMPKLLCLYMMYNYNIQQAIVTADSEEINQVNAVLQEYSSMQQVVNATTGVATSDANAAVVMQFTGTSNEVMYMFNGEYGGNPIENLYFNNSSYMRPKRPLFYTAPNQAAYSATANSWTEFGTQLSDVVTQINQQSQIKMNDVNSETKLQDRYLDLASTALSKLSDTLSQIASAT